jgi:TolB-like protein
MECPVAAGESVPVADVRGALDRILASYVFQSSPQLSAFLQFVVATTLHGQAERIKGYTIALEALGRDDSFDPQTDPIVRVEAGRLRRALEHYYAGPGAQEPVVIQLPRGTYVPTFVRRRLAANRSRSAESTIAAQTNRQVVTPFRAGNGLPVVLFHAFDTVGTPSSSAISVTLLRNKLRDALARFDEINVIFDIPSSFNDSRSRSVDRESASRYLLAARAEYDEDTTTVLNFRLIDEADGAIVWSRTFGPVHPGDKQGRTEDAITRDVATALAQPLGIIHACERDKQHELDPRHACVIATYDYLVGTFSEPGNHEMTIHARLRGSLERVTKVEPTFSLGFSMLTWIYLREHYSMVPAGPDDAPAIDRALRAAQRAVGLKPQSARAHQALSVAYFARGETAAAFEEGELALSLNPFDPFIVAGYGRRLVAAGDIERGVTLLKEAAAVSAVKSAWLDFFLFLAAYLDGDMRTASRHAMLDMNGVHPLGLVARALVAAASGDRNGAREFGEKLVTLYPVWRDDPGAALEKFIPSSEIVDRVARDLEVATGRGRSTGRKG